jgi:hypothetical protein
MVRGCDTGCSSFTDLLLSGLVPHLTSKPSRWTGGEELDFGIFNGGIISHGMLLASASLSLEAISVDSR